MRPPFKSDAGNLEVRLTGEYENDPLTFKYNRDAIDFSGLGYIRGQIQETGTGTPSRVRLVYSNRGAYADGSIVKEMLTSNAGLYEFNDLNEGLEYDIVAFKDGWHSRVLSKVKPFSGFRAPRLLKAIFDNDTKRVRLEWHNTNTVDEIRVYRSLTPFDAGSLPPVLSVLSGDALAFDDLDPKEPNQTYYYAVSNIVAGNGLTSFIDTSANWDVLYDSVRLLINFDGQAGDTAFVDLSKNPKPINNFSLSLSSEQKKFGTASLKLVGDLNKYLSISDHPDINLQNETNWTIEAYARLNTAASTSFARILDKDGRINISYPQYSVGLGQNGTVEGFCGNGAGVSPTGTQVVTTESFSNDVWYHYAFVRNGNDLILFIDGVEKARAAFSYTASGSQPLLIGKGNGSGAATGYIQSLRITAASRYTSNFTPPDGFFPTTA